MLNKAKTLQGYKLNAIDGEIGSVKEFFFDDKFWTIRYLVVNTGSWLSSRQVLISPYFIKNVDHRSELINVDLSKNEIENSPPLESDKPVSRQYEQDYYSFYGAPVYWGGPFVWGYSPSLTLNRDDWKRTTLQENEWDPNLRSTSDVRGHNIQASDDEIGHVDEFLIDDKIWSIRYLVVDTRNWWPGKKVLVSPEWIDKVSWNESKVYVQLPRDVIKEAPEYDPSELMITNDYESMLNEYYKKRGYWPEETVSRHYHR